MSAPVLLPNSPLGYDLGYNVPSGGFCFFYNGAQYIFADQGADGTASGDFHIHCLKSTDGVNFTELDAAHNLDLSPNVGNDFFNPQFTVMRDGNTVYVMGATQNNGGPPAVITGVKFAAFNLLTGTWGAPVTSTGPSGNVLDYEGRNTSPNPSASNRVFLRLVLRGPGDYVLVFSGTQRAHSSSGNLLSTLYYATFNGSVFGAGVLLPNQTADVYYLGASAIADSNKRTYVFAMDSAANSIGVDLVQWAFDDAGNFKTTQVVTGDLFWNNIEGTISEAIIFTPSGGSETVAIAAELNDNSGSTSQSLRLFYANVADVPAWANSIITQGLDATTSLGAGGVWTSSSTLFPVPQSVTWNPRPLAIAFSAGVVSAYWAVTTLSGGTNSGHTYFSQSPFSAFAWTAPALAFDSPILSGTADEGAVFHVFAWATSTAVQVFAMTGLARSGGGFPLSGNEAAQFFLAGSNPPPPSPSPVTLTFKGMKVY